MILPLRFLRDLPVYHEVQPYELYGISSEDASLLTNYVFKNVNVFIEDVRKIDEPCSIDGAGFQLIKHQSAVSLKAHHFEYGSEIVNQYLEETRELVRRETGAGRVIVYDWRFRRNSPVTNAGEPSRHNARGIGGTMHCDYSYDGGLDQIKMHLLESELHEIALGNFNVMIMNTWRPLEVVKNAPLLFCDRRTVRKSDLVEIDKVYPNRIEKGMFLYHRDYHRWYWYSHQCPDEVFMFPCWNLNVDKLSPFADCAPHGASALPIQGEIPRESIEVRTIVLIPTVNL